MEMQLKERNTSSVPRLEAAVCDVWNNLEKSTLHNLALSIPHRFREVIVHKGRPKKQ